LKICVLQVDYSTSVVEYKNWDPKRDLTPFVAPGDTVDHVFVHKLWTYKQLKELSTKGYDVFVNLCEGYLEWDVPGIEVVHALELLNLPYTGPTPAHFDHPKPLMKYIAHSVGVDTPRHAVVRAGQDVVAAVRRAKLAYPLFVKPIKAGDSLGVDDASLVRDEKALGAKCAASFPEYPELLIEEYIEGREFTVLVIGEPEGRGRGHALAPIEYRFPQGRAFKTYALKTSELHPECNVRVADEALAARLRAAAEAVFRGFDGVGYARMDFRMGPDGRIHFLEVNFSCSVFYTDGWDGSADFIVKADGIGHAGFLQAIIAEGLARYERKNPPFALHGDAIAGYGIVATRDLLPGDIVFRGEERAQRLITRQHVERTWSEAEQALFRRYAYPVADEVYLFWDSDPAQWAPQNHSCEPNCRFEGLDVVAIKPVAVGDELTLDYAMFLDASAEPFDCQCGAASCRGRIQGTPGNSVSARARAASEIAQ
jgi:D-alanine-D-alanine ligase-like ATP-grasp enzyme